MKIIKGALTMIKARRRIACNIYKLSGNTGVGDVAWVESNNDATKIWHMRLGYLNEREMM